ncbi:DUF4124 domain-containing protein [Pseudoxanthomonas sp. JBR18]|uniref:DUF4124 domain-containing protein n=1 Tax=Pseudoxanthomonas sp. JBR18 TaxID=2969308 RepID=UPI002305F83E|nr:DUF4124 domain-containing protein [Pseudoxanthomonas sp. JBR18]WCE04828.1 hypothetical protein PJ250_02195 [Pseudoxanthomonas sp. JBR18]
MLFKPWATATLLLASLSCAGGAFAQTTIYKCTDAKGELTIQNTPCPDGSRQDKREVKDVATQPLPPALSAPTPRQATPAKDPAPVPSTPPPPLHLSADDPTPAAPPAPSGPATVIYRCTDPQGATTVQNNPCPAGSKSDKRAVQGVAAMPLPSPGRPTAPVASARPVPPPADASPSAAVPAADDAPVQTIQTINGMTLIEDPSLHKDDAAADALAGRGPSSSGNDDDGAPAPDALPPPILFKCTTYDRGTYLTEQAEPQSRCAPLKTVGLDGNAFAGSGKACEVIHDVCARVTDQALCPAWKKRLGEAEVAWRYARPQDQASRKADYDRVRRIVQETCKP